MKHQKLDYRRLEQVVRGFANHRRIQILELIDAEPEMDVVTVSRRLAIDFRTVASHIRRLFLAGLVTKHAKGASVQHRVTEQGRAILMFLRTVE